MHVYSLSKVDLSDPLKCSCYYTVRCVNMLLADILNNIPLTSYSCHPGITLE